MKLIVLGSSSKGNCYLLQSESGKCLMIEAGIAFSKVKEAVGFNISNIVGCLVSHQHKDHSRSVKDVLNNHIAVYTNETTAEELGVKNNRLIAVDPDTQFSIDEFCVIPFDVPHDVRCFGFLIRHNESGVILFITDCYYCPKVFSGLTNILIECNYRLDILDENTRQGRIPPVQRNRTLQSHLSYDTCRETLLANDLSQVNNIVLIHLSDGNSNANEFQQGIHEATGKTVHVAGKGMIINFNKEPF